MYHFDIYERSHDLPILPTFPKVPVSPVCGPNIYASNMSPYNPARIPITVNWEITRMSLDTGSTVMESESLVKMVPR